jgi:hypothetical protein
MTNPFLERPVSANGQEKVPSIDSHDGGLGPFRGRAAAVRPAHPVRHAAHPRKPPLCGALGGIVFIQAFRCDIFAPNLSQRRIEDLGHTAPEVGSLQSAPALAR